jgi:signal transduction histidine kinase/DNA-binding response OmpR family regulator/ligand-binding sensor domain-containing protein
MNYFSTLIGLALSTLSCLNVFGSNASYIFRTLSPEGGFYYDGVGSIQQDSEGFVWVLMNNDIYRFDGYEYKRYGSSFRKISRQERWVYHNITADTGGRILVSTGKGVYAYEREQDRFVEVFAGSNSHLWVDSYNNLWVKNRGRFCIVRSDTLFAPPFDKNPASYSARVGCTYNGEFYVFATSDGMYRYDYIAEELVLCASLPNSDNVMQAKADGNTLWVLTQHGGMYGIDMASYAVGERISIFPDNGLMARDLYIDKNGMAWVASSNGLFVVNPVTKEYSLYLHDLKRPFTIPNSSVWCVAGDKQGNVWIGTYAGGLCYVNIGESQPFTTCLPERGQLNHAPVSGFAESSEYLWISTEGGGLNRMCKRTGKFTYLRSRQDDYSPAYDNIKSMATESSSKLWIAMYVGGLDLYNMQTRCFVHFKSRPGDSASLLYNNLRKVVADTAGGGLWIAYQATSTVLSFMSFKDHSISHYYLDSGAYREQYIFDMALDRNGSLWIAGQSRLYCMDVKARRCRHVPLDSARYLYAQSVCCDKQGVVWVGTIGNGLYRYDPARNACSVFRDFENFNPLSIYSLCPDNEGYIWMGTDNGMFRYSATTATYSRFDKKDGVQGQVYYPLASFRGSDGRIYFGGTDGFTIVEPRKVVSNSHKPKVIISDFFIDNKPAILHLEKVREGAGSRAVGEVTLSHSQANFGFKFSSDNYFIPEKNMFRYRLVGYDNRWIAADAANRTVLYSKVPAGTYYLEVAAANNDGIWSDTPTVIKIRRKAAPWLSLTAYFFYAVAAGSVLFVVYYYYNGRKKLRMQLYLEGIEKDKKEQIHQSQLRFFTNISHDFRTPLSLIAAALGRIREKNHIDDAYYSILSSNTNRLLNLVNELMDFRTIENGMMRFEPAPFNVAGVAKAIAADFTEYAHQRDISFEVVVDPTTPETLYADKNILEKVVINLLHNAFKYTSNGGAISLELYADAAKFTPQYQDAFAVSADATAEQCFCIAVRDTGVGISKEDMPSVFERFYKVNTAQADAHLGTGIGLALVKSLVLLHRGTISIHSERELGTDMAVALPATKDFYVKLGLLDGNEALPSGGAKSHDEVVAEKLEEDIPCARKRQKILLVEDNGTLRSLITESLVAAGYDVLEAANGQEAIDAIRSSEGIDLIISDIMMPVKDGITLCREVKENVETSHIPFILLTARTDVESKLQGADSGADLYFEKPLDLALLRMSVQNVLKQQQHLKERYARSFGVSSAELPSNPLDNDFLKRFADILEKNLSTLNIDMDFIASELSMSHTKFYGKVKKLTGKPPVEFINSYRMRKAARLIVEGAMTTGEIMLTIGISSNAYYTNVFKREFGMTPTAFAAKYRKNQSKYS